MKKRKRFKRLVCTAVFLLLLVCGTLIAAASEEENYPREMDFTVTRFKPFGLGDEISASDFQLTINSDIGDFNSPFIAIAEAKVPVNGLNASNFTWYTNSNSLTVKKDMYYAVGIGLRSKHNSRVSGRDEKYAAGSHNITINGENAEVYIGRSLWASKRQGFNIYEFYVGFLINYTPEQIHPSHTWGVWTKQNDGSMMRTCTNSACGETETHTHTFGAWKTIVSAAADREEMQTRQCSSDICNHESQERTIHSIHVYDSYKIVSQPTATADGQKIGTCRVCNMTASFAIPHLESDQAVPSVSSFPLKKGQSYTVTIDKLVNTDRVASWTSQTPNIAVVDSNGHITGLKAGTAIIQAKLASGKVIHVLVKVQNKPVKTKKITGLPGKLAMKKGEKQQLKAVLSPVTTSEKLLYTTSDKKIVTVSKKGVIKARKKGKAVITVKSGKKTKKIRITVK